MNNLLFKNALRFFILVIIQIFLLNQIRLGGYINPYLYVLFILLLPFETPRWLLLILAFVLGLIIDIFSGTMGMHTAASVLMAFARPGVLKMIATKAQYESGVKPGIQDMGFPWFFSYAGLLIFIHHFLLFYIEVFRFSEFFTTFFRIILSSIVTLALVILSQYLFLKIKK